MTVPYRIEYHLQPQNGAAPHIYSIEIDPQALISTPLSSATPPDWARLEHEKCDNCTLSGTEYCPIAARLAHPVAQLKDIVSHERVTASVITPQRTYSKEVDIQEAIRSMFGLIMATSGCPSMEPFRFMARHHLPFSSMEETIARYICAYLMGHISATPTKTPTSPTPSPLTSRR